MAARASPRLKAMDDGPPKKKRRKTKKHQSRLDAVAPHATLDGLPDNVVLYIMDLLNLPSLLKFSRVCRRFKDLSKSKFLWERVDLSSNSFRFLLSNRDVRRIMHTYLPPSLKEIALSSNYHGRLSQQSVITFALLNNFVLANYPSIQRLTLMNCDLTKDRGTNRFVCHNGDYGRFGIKLYHSETLECLTFHKCLVKNGWFNNLKPTWPNLTYLSLKESTGIIDDDLRYIGNCKKWRENLRYLNLRGCTLISKCVLIKACVLLTGLKTLDVRDCPSISQTSDCSDPMESISILRDKLKHISRILLTFYVQTDHVIVN